MNGVVIVESYKECKQHFPQIPVQPNADSQLFLLLINAFIEHRFIHELMIKEIEAGKKAGKCQKVGENSVSCGFLELWLELLTFAMETNIDNAVKSY